MDTWTGIIFIGIVIGSTYGWLSAKASHKGYSDSTTFLGIVAAFGGVAYGWSLLQTSVAYLIVFLILTFFIAFWVNFIASRAYNAGPTHKNIKPHDPIAYYAEKMGMSANMGAIQISNNLPVSDRESIVWVIDLISYALLLTYLELDHSQIQQHRYKAIMQDVVKAVAKDIGKHGKDPEDVYQSLMQAFSDFTKKYGDFPKPKGGSLKPKTLLHEASRGMLSENLPEKQTDELSMKYVARTLLTIEDSLDIPSFIYSLR